MTDIKTKSDLLAALEQAALTPPTADELHQQRVSFIMGSLKVNSAVTRAQVQKVLEDQKGRK